MTTRNGSLQHEQDPLLSQTNGSYQGQDVGTDTFRRLSANGGFHDVVMTAIDAEHKSSFREAVLLYPSAIFWSLFFSLGVIMHAFDSQLLGNLYATPAFQRDFGYFYNGSYIIPAAWQTGLSIGSPLGQIFGAFYAAYPMEWYGRKITLGVCVIMTSGCVLIQFFAKSLPVLLVGELLGGLVLGTYIVIAPAYASEVCPMALRGVLTGCTNICFVVGQLLANGVIAGTSRLDSHWAYSTPFAVQWIWPILILAGLPFAPESPWWLQRQNRLVEAEEALKQLASADVDVKPVLAMIIETDRLEREIEAGSTYQDCFLHTNLRRTEIASGVYCVQVLCGIYLIGYATYFFQLAGLPTSQAFNMSIAVLWLGLLGTIASWPLLLRYGRREIYLPFLALLALLQIVIGLLDCVPSYTQQPIFAWSQAVIMLIWDFCYGCSVGPLCFVILCEVSATRVRSRTIAVATAAQALLGVGMAFILPLLFNRDQLNARGKVGFLFGGLGILCWVWAWFRLPEMRGRTDREVNIMFEKEVRTRDFKHYVVE